MLILRMASFFIKNTIVWLLNLKKLIVQKLLQQIGIGIMSARTEEILRDSENDLDLLFKFILESNGYDRGKWSQLNRMYLPLLKITLKEGFCRIWCN